MILSIKIKKFVSKSGNDISIKILQTNENAGGYPTNSIPKGLTLAYAGIDLTEEGVGFGIPVLKRQFETIFPGNIKIISCPEDHLHIIAEYEMNLIERLSMGKTNILKNRFMNSVKEIIAMAHRRMPFMRNLLTNISNLLRFLFGIKTVFETVESAGIIIVDYRIELNQNKILINADTSRIDKKDLKEISIMNELGANYFDRYHDSDGVVLSGKSIGTWQKVFASNASFHDILHSLFFRVYNINGASLYRGRELVKGRLVWAGFAYVFPPVINSFQFAIEFGVEI